MVAAATGSKQFSSGSTPDDGMLPKNLMVRCIPSGLAHWIPSGNLGANSRNRIEQLPAGLFRQADGDKNADCIGAGAHGVS